MKDKLIAFLIFAGITISVICYNTVSCNDHKSIPPNSIYQEGDVVYNLNYAIKTANNEKMPMDGHFIFREENNEVIEISNYSKPIQFFVHKIGDDEYMSDSASSGDFTIIFKIEDNYIDYTLKDGTNNNCLFHISSIDHY